MSSQEGNQLQGSSEFNDSAVAKAGHQGNISGGIYNNNTAPKNQTTSNNVSINTSNQNIGEKAGYEKPPTDSIYGLPDNSNISILEKSDTRNPNFTQTLTTLTENDD